MQFLSRFTVNRKNIHLFLLAVLILTAAFFRFYKVRDYVVFLGDEGRDMIVMRNIFVNHDLPFLGPTASVGGFYLGPIYYWIAAPFLFLFRFDPVGPSYMVALFGFATVIVLYKFLKEAVGFWPALLASFLYATAPLIVRYSRSSWNPNPLPFFSLLLIYFVYKGIKSQKLFYYFLAGASFGVAIQLHYLSAILAPLAAVIIIFNEKFKKIPAVLLVSIAGSILTFSPFLIFEIKNGFPNFRTILEFVTRGSTVGVSLGNLSWRIANNANIFLESITAYTGTPITKYFIWITAPVVLAALISSWRSEKKLINSIGFSYFVGGATLIGLYSGQIHDYYFGSIFPAPFVLFGVFASVLWKKTQARYVLIISVIAIMAVFYSRSFLHIEPNRLISQTDKISNKVIEMTGGGDFNFASISGGNSDHAYRYFLEINNKKPLPLEEQVTDQLIIVCEEKNCSPQGHPTWEIAGFGMAEIEKELELPEYGFKIYRMVHAESSAHMIGKPATKGI